MATKKLTKAEVALTVMESFKVLTAEYRAKGVIPDAGIEDKVTKATSIVQQDILEDLLVAMNFGPNDLLVLNQLIRESVNKAK